MIFGTVTEQVGQQMENTEDIQVILADRQEVLRILRQERVSMRCGLMLMQFLKAETEAPFAFYICDRYINRKHKRQGRTCHSEKFGNDDFGKRMLIFRKIFIPERKR